MGKPTAEQLAKINQLAKTPLTEDQVYVFNAKLIGDKPIPMRFQRVTPNFLRKMAEDAKAGVSLMLDHSWANFGILAMPYGRTFDAILKQDGDELALYADHYIVRGQTLNGVATDDIISAIDSGTLFDTSVGYIPTKNICSIDGFDYFGGKCLHYRGCEYDGEICSVEQDDGRLMENSLVFDGAYPGAGVVAASQKQAKEGNGKAWVSTQDEEAAKNAERIFCSYSQKTGLHEFVQQKPEGDESTLENKQTPQQMANDQALQQAQAALSTATGLLGQIRTTLGVSADGDIITKITVLSEQAQVGEKYKVKVTEEACGAGVRALGEAFNVDAMKLSLSNLPVTEIEKIRDSYEAQAKAILGNGGRQTVGGDVELPAGASAGAAPANPQAAGGQPTPEQLQAKAKEDARAALNRTGNGHLVKEAK
jgi:hypothetical protein